MTWLFFGPFAIHCGKRLQQAALKLAAGQLLLVSLVAAIAATLSGQSAAFSAFVGGGIGTVCGLYQAMRMFRRGAAEDPERFLRSVYVSELMKIVLTVALMILAIRTLNVNFLPFMLGYIASYAVYWIALGTGYPWMGDPELTREQPEHH